MNQSEQAPQNQVMIAFDENGPPADAGIRDVCFRCGAYSMRKWDWRLRVVKHAQGQGPLAAASSAFIPGAGVVNALTDAGREKKILIPLCQGCGRRRRDAVYGGGALWLLLTGAAIGWALLVRQHVPPVTESGFYPMLALTLIPPFGLLVVACLLWAKRLQGARPIQDAAAVSNEFVIVFVDSAVAQTVEKSRSTKTIWGGIRLE